MLCFWIILKTNFLNKTQFKKEITGLDAVQWTVETLFTWTVPKWIITWHIDAAAWKAIESCFSRIGGLNGPHIHNNLRFNVTKQIVYAVCFKSCCSRVNKLPLRIKLHNYYFYLLSLGLSWSHDLGLAT